MKKNYLKTTLELLGLQIFFALFSFMFSIFFSWMKNWSIIFSVFTAWLFLGSVHSTFWQMGNKDSKNINIYNNHLKDGEEIKKPNLIEGLKYGGLFFVVNVLVVLIAMVFENDSEVYKTIYNIHRVLLMPFFGFLPEVSGKIERDYWIISYGLCVVMYIPCITAYISGLKGFSLTEKIVPKIIYKSKK